MSGQQFPRRTPHFIIIGAQKCGTTSFYRNLLRHPQIVSASKKEVHFFDVNFAQGIDWYLDHFPPIAADDPLITGEASPYYLFHPLVPERVAKFSPAIRLIVLLRNPIDRAISHYYHQHRRGEETQTFLSAIELENQRLEKEEARILADHDYESNTHRNCSYLTRGRYIEQLQRWMKFFPKEQFLILKSETLFADPTAIMQQSFQFLGLEPYDLDQFEVFNQGNYEPLDTQTRRRLAEYFQPYNQKLEQFLQMQFDWEMTNPNSLEMQQQTGQVSHQKPALTLERAKQKLEQSRVWLNQFQSSSFEIPSIAKTEIKNLPNLAFITCIEPGYLEAQSLLLYESIRRHTGRFRHCPIYAFSPRPGYTLSHIMRKRLEQLEVIYSDRPLNTRLPFFSMANKAAACAEVEAQGQHEILVWLDSDTLFFREPQQFDLPDFFDVAVRPINRKRNCTSGLVNHPFDAYWRTLCQYGQLDYNDLPFLETCVDRKIIKACYNAGLIVVRSQKAIFRQWFELLQKSVDGGFDPRVDLVWDNDQPALSIAIWRNTKKVNILEPVYNYNIRAIDNPPQQKMLESSLPLVHIHYHKTFNFEYLDRNPLLQPDFELEESLKSWLLPRLPIDKPFPETDLSQSSLCFTSSLLHS